MIQISVFNESTVITDAEVQSMIGAFQTQWNRDLAPVWGLEEAAFTFTDKANPPPSGSFWVVFLDDSDQAGALAYHDLTDQGLPLSKVFVKTLKGDGASVSVGATHEICEMAVDPTINLAAQDANGTFWAYEVCDPVEADEYGYDIGGVLVTDFVTPAWFGFKNAAGPIDFQGHASEPFAVLDRGYAQQFGPNGWVQVNGKNAKSQRATSAPKGSRRLRRAGKRADWKRSETLHVRNELRAKQRR